LERAGIRRLDVMPLQLLHFRQIGLPIGSNDREIWRYVQARQMLLLTGNRNMDGEHSLGVVIREENQASSLPVLTIGNIDRVAGATYRRRCANRLAEIVIYLDDYRGTGRIYLP
jgi:hypothetical protein